MVLLSKFFAFILSIIILYSVLFHVLMLYEGKEYSWVTGFYWTLTVMSTLGFGDITFSTDLGLVFTVFVLVSGVVLLLIMLPFSFIQFFYAPWLEAQSTSLVPRELPEDISGHVIITNLDPITKKLIVKLERRQFKYVLLAPDLHQAMELHDSGYKVIVGEPDDPATYQRLRVEKAALVVATNDDLINTSIAFTVRGLTEKVPIITSADKEHSRDILEYPGNIQVFQFTKMLGDLLGQRTVGLGRALNIVSSFDKLHIAEISVLHTSLGGKILGEVRMRQKSGASVVGLWEKGKFELPGAQTQINSTTVLLLVGTMEQLDTFEEIFATPEKSYKPDAPVLILGGGRVGIAVAETLEQHNIPYKVVEKRPTLVGGKNENFILGDAADIDVLKKAGLNEARTVIITTHNDAMNIYLAFYCRQLRPRVQIITRATNERSVSKLHMAGADLVLSYASMGANNIINVLNPDEVTMFTEGLSIFSLSVPKALNGKKIIESKIREKTGCSIIALKHSGELVVGLDPLLVLREKDEIVLIGTTESERQLLELF